MSEEKPGGGGEFSLPPLEEKAKELIAELGKSRMEELAQEERYDVARKLIDLGYPVNQVVKLLRVSVRKRSKYSQPQPAAGAPTPVGEPRATLRQVHKTVEAVVTEKAKKEVEKTLDVGSKVLEFLEERARRYGYEDVFEFVVDIYNFWENYKDEVRRLEEENRLYAAALDKLLKLSDRQLIEAFKTMKELQILEARAYAAILGRLIKQLDTGVFSEKGEGVIV